MKKISKRFLTLAITCVMAMAMAVPAFADWTIEVDDNSNRYINVYGTYGSSLNMRYLTLYKTSAPKSEQCFHLYRTYIITLRSELRERDVYCRFDC